MAAPGAAPGRALPISCVRGTGECSCRADPGSAPGDGDAPCVDAPGAELRDLAGMKQTEQPHVERHLVSSLRDPAHAGSAPISWILPNPVPTCKATPLCPARGPGVDLVPPGPRVGAGWGRLLPIFDAIG
jgi:hypothetical protein